MYIRIKPMKPLRLTTDNTLKRITKYAGKAPEGLESLSHSALVRMVREKLYMTQAQLAKRAGVPQSHIAKIEIGKMHPRLDTLQKILKALHCDLLLVPKPVQDLDAIIHERISQIAKKRVDSVAGTMRLEDQSPPSQLLDDMRHEEESKLLRNPTSKIWEE